VKNGLQYLLLSAPAFSVDYDSKRYKINKLAIINAKTWTLFLQILENFPRCLTPWLLLRTSLFA